jgi:hypothetical protein
MTVSWSARVLRKGKPLPPGKCSVLNGTCSAPTASIDPSVLLDAYGADVSTPAISGYRTSYADAGLVPDIQYQYWWGSDANEHFVAACPNFAPSGNLTALMFSAPPVNVTDWNGTVDLGGESHVFASKLALVK